MFAPLEYYLAVLRKDGDNMKKALLIAVPMAAVTATICVITARRKGNKKLSVDPNYTSPHVQDDSQTNEPYYAKSLIWCD